MAVNRYNRPLVDSTGGVSARNASQSQQANRNAQPGWGEPTLPSKPPDDADGWTPTSPPAAPAQPGSPAAPSPSTWMPAGLEPQQQYGPGFTVTSPDGTQSRQVFDMPATNPATGQPWTWDDWSPSTPATPHGPVTPQPLDRTPDHIRYPWLFPTPTTLTPGGRQAAPAAGSTWTPPVWGEDSGDLRPGETPYDPVGAGQGAPRSNVATPSPGAGRFTIPAGNDPKSITAWQGSGDPNGVYNISTWSGAPDDATLRQFAEEKGIEWIPDTKSDDWGRSGPPWSPAQHESSRRVREDFINNLHTKWHEAQGATVAGGAGVPEGVNPDDPKWDQWLRTDGGRDHTSANILGFLQTHYGGQFNKAGLTAALPTMQWLFGSHIKIVGSGGDKIDFGPPLGVVDLIRDVKGEHGGTAWIWLPDKDNTNLHGGGGGRGAAGAGGGQYGMGAGGSTWYQPGAGGYGPAWSGQGGWYAARQTPNVTFPTPGVSTQYAPGTAPADGLPTYGGFQYTNEGLPVYQQVNYDPNITYRPGQVSQFQAPDQSALNQLQGTTVQQMLENPTLSDQVLAQMREQHKDTVLSLGEQLGQQASQRAAAQGTFGGGQYGSTLGDIQQSMAGDITKGYRDLNVRAADLNRQAQERALAASENVLSGQMNRGIAGYQAGLGGQMAQEGLYQQGAESLRGSELLRAQEHQRAYQNQLANQAWLREGQQLQAGEGRYAFGTEQQAAQDMYQRYLSGEQLQQQRAQMELQRYQTWADQQARQQQMAIQMYLGRGGLAMNQDQLALQRIQEQRLGNQWQWENLGGLF